MVLFHNIFHIKIKHVKLDSTTIFYSLPNSFTKFVLIRFYNKPMLLVEIIVSIYLTLKDIK